MSRLTKLYDKLRFCYPRKYVSISMDLSGNREPEVKWTLHVTDEINCREFNCFDEMEAHVNSLIEVNMDKEAEVVL